MARSIDDKLAALRTLDVTAPKALDVLRDALRSTSGILVARAVKLVEEHRLEALVPELAPAFERFLVDPVKRDPMCRAKIAIARALDTLEEWDDRVFVTGLRVVQKEGGMPAEDTAGELRGVCGLVHARFMRPDALDVLARLLGDPVRTPRVAAAQGLGDAGRPDASALLRYKIAEGDDEPEVLSAAIDSLLSLARDASIPFLVELLAENDLRAEVAALALGGARIPEVFEPLVAWSEGCRPADRHRVGYLAIALLRSDRATSYLLEIVGTGTPTDAIAAAGALATFKDDPSVADQLSAAANRRDARDPKTKRAILAKLD
jgi:hypothetical protein